MSTATQSPKFRLDGKSAIITGGACGIGSAISTAFADAGATVHIVDLDGAAATATSSALISAGAKAFAHTCNVADQARVEDIFSAILARQPIDILVNNAGVSSIAPWLPPLRRSSRRYSISM
jgi:2-keto-3-deoxy-L-fuconate dehydrogenase